MLERHCGGDKPRPLPLWRFHSSVEPHTWHSGQLRFAFPTDKVGTVIAFLHASKWKLRVCKNLSKFSELGSGMVWI